MQEFDCIVIGLGGIGSSALHAATKRKLSVLGLDQFPSIHDRGSSHGITRIIRTAYFEHPNYVPLAQTSLAMWKDIENYSGRNLMNLSGLLQVGSKQGSVIEGVMASVDQHQLNVEVLEPEETRRRFPNLRIDDNEIAIFEQSAGYLFVEKCIATQLALAEAGGAQINCRAGAVRWERLSSTQIKVTTADNTFVTTRLVIAAGAWSTNVLQDLDLRLKVKRKSQFWFNLPPASRDRLRNTPTYFYETSSGCFYGFPWMDGVGLKVAEHTGGEWVNDPENLDREVNANELQRVETFIRERLGDIEFNLRNHSVCMYTMTKDEHFIVDRHPTFDNVVFAAGLSGHGFKFSPVLGHYLLRLLDNDEDSNMQFLKFDRAALK